MGIWHGEEGENCSNPEDLEREKGCCGLKEEEACEEVKLVSPSVTVVRRPRVEGGAR